MRLSRWVVFFSAVFVQTTLADQLVCTQPNNVVTVNGSGRCTLPGPVSDPNMVSYPLIYQTQFLGGISNGEFGAQVSLTSISLATNLSGAAFPMTISATWDDTYFLPQSKPTDILKIQASIFGLGGTPDIQIGPSPALNYNVPCDFHFPQYCGTTPTNPVVVPASGISFVRLSGTHAFTLTDNEPFDTDVNGTDLAVGVTIDRFLADGKTPDPFASTPEPSDIGVLAGLSGILITLVRRLQL